MPGYVLRFMGLSGSSGLLYTDISKALSNLLKSTEMHIMQSKHEWKLVGKNDWGTAYKAIEFVLKKVLDRYTKQVILFIKQNTKDILFKW